MEMRWARLGRMNIEMRKRLARENSLQFARQVKILQII